MRRILLLVVVVAIAPAFAGWGVAAWQAHRRGQAARSFDSSSTFAARVAAAVATADAVAVGTELSPSSSARAIADPAWQHRLSTALLDRPFVCLCAGWRTVSFYRNGALVVSVAAIHGHQLRIRLAGGGGDYPVDAATWDEVNTLLRAAQ